MPRVALHTLGCKLNFAETSTITKQFVDRGFEVVEFGEPADVCVINTCTVTQRADRECRQLIRRALRADRKPVVVVTGCYAQLEPEQIASIDGVDLVLGSREKFTIFEYLPAAKAPALPRVHVSEISAATDFGPASSTEAGGRTRAFLKVQDGCDYTCSFCTIPLARGESRSQSVEATMHQARMLVASGYREIVLTGVNVGDYGRKDGTNLLTLLRGLAGIDGLARVRISSIEPNLLTRELLDFVAGNPVMCDHFHIPLQSGSDAVLRLMRRRYTSEDYARLVARVKDRIPRAGVGADVIVGFPGETDKDFEQTYRFLTDLPISYLHVFTYSERPHTPAARYTHRVGPEVRSRRNTMLRTLSEMKRNAFCREHLGMTAPVLMESDVESGLRNGLTTNYIRVALPAATTAANEIIHVRLDTLRDGICEGTPVSQGRGR